MSAAQERTGEGALARLRTLLRREGGLMATLVEPEPTVAAPGARNGNGARNGHGASPGSIAANGPRAAGRRE
ncbi:MAG: hypothetical protein ACLQBY_09235, partial [Solirubrobacteraceae bacterium]